MRSAQLSTLSAGLLFLMSATAIGWSCGEDAPPKAPTSATPSAPTAADPGGSMPPPSDQFASPSGPSGGGGFTSLSAPVNPAPPSTVVGSATPPSPAAPGYKTARVAVDGGTITTIDELEFAPGDNKILPATGSLLDEVAQVIRAHPELKKIRVEGHTASARDGQLQLTASQLFELSLSRAQAVVSWLAARGVDPKMLTAQGYGASQPLVHNETDEQQAKNRRVAFVIVAKDDLQKSGGKGDKSSSKDAKDAK